MCGINTIVSFENKTEKNFLINKKTILRMNEAIKRRGFDSSGIFISDKKNIFLGNVKLAITDIKNAIQPIIKVVGSIKYVIVFNGQIYNFKEIAQELKEFKFNKNSDTEVLLFSYIKWGEECLKKLNGDFSFIIYNEKKDEVFFARDRFGIKPFYYYFDDEKFIISSEVKGILENKKIKKEVNMEAVSEFLLGNFAFSAGSAPTDQTFLRIFFSWKLVIVVLFLMVK